MRSTRKKRASRKRTALRRLSGAARWGGGLLCIGVLCWFALLAASSPSTKASSLAPVPVSPGIHMAYTEDTVGETLAHLCQEPLVSLVTVGHLGIPHWNSQNGARPAGIPARDLTKGGYTIYTPVQFSAMTTLVDHRSAPTREFDLPGGAVGQDDIRDLDAPVLLPNHRYILVFVPGLDPGSSTNDPTWFTVYWTYRVVGTSIVTQEQGIQQGKVAQPEQREPLAQLEAFLAAGCR